MSGEFLNEIEEYKAKIEKLEKDNSFLNKLIERYQSESRMIAKCIDRKDDLLKQFYLTCVKYRDKSEELKKLCDSYSTDKDVELNGMAEWVKLMRVAVSDEPNSDRKRGYLECLRHAENHAEGL